jgi:hypothetical protein
MISPTYFVSASHWHPVGGDTVTFYEGNSLAGPSHQFTVSSGAFQTSVGGVGSDLWLGKLDTPIPESDNISYYPVPLLPDNNSYVGQMIYVNGKPNRVGRNIIDRITTAQEPDPPATPWKNTVAMEFDYNTTSGLGADECYLIGGDSGGPSFIDVNGQLSLVGIHYYNMGTPGPGDLGMISGDSFVPYYVDQLNGNMTGESVARIVPVPGLVVWKGGNSAGPSSWALAANWDPNTAVPDGAGTKVGFGNQPAANSVVDMSMHGRTVGSITFFAATSTTIQSSGGAALTLDNNGVLSTIDVAGTQTISAPVVMNDDVTMSGDGTLNLSGGIIGGDSTLTVRNTITASSIQVDSLVIGGSGAVAAVPEPGSAVMLLSIAAGGAIFWRRWNLFRTR